MTSQLSSNWRLKTLYAEVSLNWGEYFLQTVAKDHQPVPAFTLTNGWDWVPRWGPGGWETRFSEEGHNRLGLVDEKVNKDRPSMFEPLTSNTWVQMIDKRVWLRFIWGEAWGAKSDMEEGYVMIPYDPRTVKQWELLFLTQQTDERCIYDLVLKVFFDFKGWRLFNGQFYLKGYLQFARKKWRSLHRTRFDVNSKEIHSDPWSGELKVCEHADSPACRSLPCWQGSGE